MTLRERVAVVADVPAVAPLAAEAKSVAVDDDPSWLELSRSRSPRFPERFLSGSISAFPIERIFRSFDLNTFDRPIPLLARRHLQAFVSQELARLSNLQYSIQDVAYHWLKAQIANQAVRPLQFLDSPEVRRYLDENRRPGVVLFDSWLYEGGDRMDWIYSISGVTYGVRFSELPDVREPFSLLTFQRQNLAIRVGEWFQKNGYLSPQAWGQYLERVYDPRD